MSARRVGALLAALVLALATTLGAAGPAGIGPSAALAAGGRHLKVAIIVGPVGSMTDFYRRLANEGAAVARRHADQVVTVYSPDATWPAVRAAMNGASVVVYLGHGNGFPSPYSGTLRPTVMNGLGLNPVAGVDDEAHQYFGEAAIARSVRLAPGAAVILSHLCYASGAAEPGMANPSLNVAVARVDNFGAGFLAAGAAAVVAEAHGGPAPYLSAIFAGRGTIESIWRSHRNYHGHERSFASSRTAGARLYLDPDRPASGYYRSLVVRPGVRTADILAGAPAGAAAPAPAAGGTTAARSLAARGAAPPRLSLAGPAVAGTGATLRLVFDARTAALLPAAYTIGTRWNLLAADAVVGPAAAPGPGPSPAPAPGSPSPSPDPGSWSGGPADPTPTPPPDPAGTAAPAGEPATTPAPGSPAPDPGPPAALPSASPAAGPGTPGPADDPGPAATPVPEEPVIAPEPPAVDLVKEEVSGSLVTLGPASTSGRRPSVVVALPARPGLYRLVVTLHDAAGVAYDAATQELFPALVVQVTGPLWASYGTPDQVAVGPGGQLDLRVAVANSGSLAWGSRPTESLVDPAPMLAATPPLLVARWVGLDGGAADGSDGAPAGVVPAYVEPGTAATLEMVLTAPAVEGTYLLLLDVLLPDGRSLAAAGAPPGLVRVTVGDGAAGDVPAADPAGAPSPAPSSSPSS